MQATALVLVLPFLAGRPSVPPEAQQLFERGEYRRAAELAAQAQADSPAERGATALFRGRALLKAREWESAASALEEAVRLRPEEGRYHLWLGRAYGQWAAHAFFIKAIGLAKKTRTEFETACRLDPTDLDARFDLMQFYAEASGIVGGGEEKARREAEEIARQSPRQGYAARASIAVAKQHYDVARRELAAAVLEFPGRADTHLDLGEFLLERNDAAGAEAAARSALGLEPASTRARYLLARSLVAQGRDLKPAAEALGALLAGRLGDADPDRAEVYRWLGDARRALGEWAAARAAYAAALRLDPESEPVKRSLEGLPSGG
jgi:predicted Zn-dependent protease